ncbi:hypothetical protein WMW72_07140 [Paenibacillus filicis]|uniref:Uncharacterized protein n=1 Tax=Paenibacillus filicis TaxID=669464 RepID=A0ABU9DFT0_9BACL
MNGRSVESNPTGYVDFEWFLPTERKKEFVITVTSANSFSVNQTLREQLWKRITIGVGPGGRELCFKEQPEGFFVPKNGNIKAHFVSNEIKRRGINLPARYIAEREGDCWIAIIEPIAESPAQNKKTPKKPRKNGLKSLLLEEENR